MLALWIHARCTDKPAALTESAAIGCAASHRRCGGIMVVWDAAVCQCVMVSHLSISLSGSRRRMCHYYWWGIFPRFLEKLCADISEDLPLAYLGISVMCTM